MPQESNTNLKFNSPISKNMRGLKGLIYNNNEASYADEITINDYGLAQRKAEEAATRRYQATEWLRKMDNVATNLITKQPTEEEFCMALRNGLILCNVLNKVNPGAVLKVVEIPVIDVQSMEGPAQSAIQYFENMRNFLMAVGNMKLLTFEASDLEKGGSSSKVVDCILCLKGFYEWRQAGAIGVWRYGGTVRITSFPYLTKESSSSMIDSESTDDSLVDSESSSYEQLLEFLRLPNKMSLEESKTANSLAFLFDRFGLTLLQSYLEESNGIEDLPLNSMVIDAVLRKIVKDFSALLVSQGNQLGLYLKKMLGDDCISLSKHEFLKAISAYLDQQTNMVSSEFPNLCICGGKRVDNRHDQAYPAESADIHQRELEELKATFRETKLGWDEEHKRLEHHIEGLEVASGSYHKVLEENRVLYNQIQDLKGTIRVYCRVRPFLPGQGEGQSTVDYIGDNGDIMIVNPHKRGKDARKIFTFNKVFGTNVTQQQIYADTQALIRSVVDGFNVCIFAYGQTGSGKTYTMSGPDLTTEDTWGVNYRALQDLFHISKSRVDFIEYEVSVQMIEIYNEQVRDLLVLDGANRRLDIRNNSQLNGLNVPDASLIIVKSTQDVLELMKVGQKNRAVGATALNERSSRSHSILTVHVRGRELVSGSTLKGCLHLVDLAGSERVDKSEAVGERLKEAQHINKSLSALGDVIAALAQKNSHIPYRNSKLTQVLQDSLGGNAKTLMFVHINPEADAIGETISTLKFAERVATIDLGAAKSNKETGEIRDLKDEISNLKSALEKKEFELEQLRNGAHIRDVVSPVRVPRSNSSANLKTEASFRPIEDTRGSEIQSYSSGKQRKSRFPSKFTDRDPMPRLPFLAEERVTGSSELRSPSPPIRRSLSTERGSFIKARTKNDAPENLPFLKVPFPAKVPVNKSFAVKEKNRQEMPKKENISDVIYGLQKVTFTKVLPEHEEEQFKQALNVRQGGIRKPKTESKVKTKNQMSNKTQKPNIAATLINESDTPQKSDLSDVENELGSIGSPLNSTPIGKKFPRNLPRNLQNVERREVVQTVESILVGRNENKFSGGAVQSTKESNSSSIPMLRRSQSTPRGKFMF